MNRIVVSYKIIDVEKGYKTTYFKWTYGLSGNNMRVVTLSKPYLTVAGIIMASFKLIRQS